MQTIIPTAIKIIKNILPTIPPTRPIKIVYNTQLYYVYRNNVPAMRVSNEL